jgi:hypothetical protein
MELSGVPNPKIRLTHDSKRRWGNTSEGGPTLRQHKYLANSNFGCFQPSEEQYRTKPRAYKTISGHLWNRRMRKHNSNTSYSQENLGTSEFLHCTHETFGCGCACGQRRNQHFIVLQRLTRRNSKTPLLTSKQPVGAAHLATKHFIHPPRSSSCEKRSVRVSDSQRKVSRV